LRLTYGGKVAYLTRKTPLGPGDTDQVDPTPGGRWGRIRP
jgi:hypothetical protein